MDIFIVILIVLGAVWGLLTLVGYFFTDERCPECGYWGDAQYMIRGKNGEYWHYSCFPLNKDNK